jgi:DNA repair protein RecN (Recombination protein N)
MLSVLQIKNLAIVDSLQIEFSSGLNVLTGETGAGKSIVLKAIDLLTGAKEKGDIVRSGAVACEVEGLFNLSKITPTILENLSDQAQEALQEEELIIRRVLDKTGKSKCFINGRLGSLKLLEEIANLTVDLTSQHQQQRLLTETYHRFVLDDYGVSAELLSKVSEVYAKWLEVSRALEEFSNNTAQKEAFFRQLAFEVEEFEKAKLRVGEKAELEIKLKKVGSVEMLGGLANDALLLLESEDGVEDRLGILKTKIQQ